MVLIILTGYSNWDVQNRLFQNLKAKNTIYKKTIFQLDVESCFNNISYEKIMSLITFPTGGNKFLSFALKAGALKEQNRNFLGFIQYSFTWC